MPNSEIDYEDLKIVLQMLPALGTMSGEQFYAMARLMAVLAQAQNEAGPGHGLVVSSVHLSASVWVKLTEFHMVHTKDGYPILDPQPYKLRVSPTASIVPGFNLVSTIKLLRTELDIGLKEGMELAKSYKEFVVENGQEFVCRWCKTNEFGSAHPMFPVPPDTFEVLETLVHMPAPGSMEI